MIEYKTLRDFQDKIRAGEVFDVVKVGGIIYTMDYYDFSGKLIQYANKKRMIGIEVRTKDRYKYGFQDAEVEAVGKILLRNDVWYYE